MCSEVYGYIKTHKVCNFNIATNIAYSYTNRTRVYFMRTLPWGSDGQSAARGQGGQIAPGPQAPNDLIPPDASKSGGPHKENQQYFSKVNF